MHQEDSIRYLIVVEIERKGFLVDIVKGEMVANEHVDSLVDLAYDLSFHEMYKVEQRLEYFASYTIKGNVLWTPKTRRCITNGAFTVSVVPIDLQTFCTKTFIRERENHSDAIEFSDYPNEVTERIDTLFPHFSCVAN